MNTDRSFVPMAAALGSAGVIADLAPASLATAPCGDFGECRVIVEINATDGDVGFQWLADGDELRSTEIVDPKGRRVFANAAFGCCGTRRLRSRSAIAPSPSADPGSPRILTTTPDRGPVRAALAGGKLPVPWHHGRRYHRAWSERTDALAAGSSDERAVFAASSPGSRAQHWASVPRTSSCGSWSATASCRFIP